MVMLPQRNLIPKMRRWPTHPQASSEPQADQQQAKDDNQDGEKLDYDGSTAAPSKEKAEVVKRRGEASLTAEDIAAVGKFESH
jgi:hypothetical protein